MTERKVFDWDKAALIIETYDPEWANAGLKEDMAATYGTIYENGKPMVDRDHEPFLASDWATPVLEMRIGSDIVMVDCFKTKSEAPDWDYDTI